MQVFAIATAGILWLQQGRRYQHSLAMLRDECGRAHPHRVLGTGLVLLTMAVLAMLKAVRTIHC